MKQVFSLSELEQAAASFAESLDSTKVVAFHGDMGAGKTTFISAVCRCLGSDDVMGSPTFAIINQYETDSGYIIYHMDWYRIRDEEEAINAGIEDALYSGNLCFVEWPERAAGLLPAATLHVWLEVTGDQNRQISYERDRET